MTLSEFQTLYKRLAVPHRERRQGVPVRLYRNGQSSDLFDARFRGIESAALGAVLGLDIKTEMRTWRLPIASVVLAGTTTRPQPKDRIIVDGETRVWEVNHPSDGVPACERDSAGGDWLVHTQLVSE